MMRSLFFELVRSACVLAIIGASAFAQDAATTKALHDLFDREWEYDLEESPTRASQLGDRRWNDRWSDVSLEAIKRRHDHDLRVLQNSRRSIAPNSRAGSAQLRSLQKDYESGIEEFKYRWYLVPLNQRGGIQTENELADSLRFQTVKDYEDWIARLNAFPVYMDQTIALMREGIAARMLLPKVIMQRVPAQIDRQIVANPDESLFYKPFKRFPAIDSGCRSGTFDADALAAIRANIIPSYKRFKKFFVEEYLPALTKRWAPGKCREGEAMYAFFVRKYTTTNVTPREVHEQGLERSKTYSRRDAGSDEPGWFQRNVCRSSSRF